MNEDFKLNIFKLGTGAFAVTWIGTAFAVITTVFWCLTTYTVNRKEEKKSASKQKNLPANQAGGRRDNDWEMNDDTNEFLEKCGESVEDGKVYRPYQSQASNGV